MKSEHRLALHHPRAGLAMHGAERTDLMLCCCCPEILNDVFKQGPLHFYFAPSLSKYSAGSKSLLQTPELAWEFVRNLYFNVPSQTSKLEFGR